MTIALFDPGRNLGILQAPLREKGAIVHNVTLRTEKLRDTTKLGPFLYSADDHIREALRGMKVAAIEAPNTQGSNHTGIVKNVALAGHIAWHATSMGIEVQWWNLRHAKMALTDNGNAKKEEMIAAAEMYLGLAAGTLSEHEADVFGGWLVLSYGVPMNHGDRHKLQVQRRKDEKAAAAAAKLTEGLKF